MNKRVALELAAHSEGVKAEVVQDRDTKRLLDEAAQASRELASDKKYREELRAWTGHGEFVSKDYGLPAENLASQPKGRRYPPVRDLGLTWDSPGEVVDYEKRSQLIKLTAETDTPSDWMRMGQALQRLLLTATRYGVQASLLTQQIEVVDWKGTYKRTNPWWPSSKPMILIRLGYASEPGDPARNVAGTPR